MWYSAQHFTCAKNEGTAYSITAANIVSWFLLVDKKWPIFCHTLDFVCDFFTEGYHLESLVTGDDNGYILVMVMIWLELSANF